MFSMSKLIGVDTYLGPEMKSTGEVMGIDRTFPAALAKAVIAADMALPPKGGALLSISDRTKADAIPVIRRLHQAGYRLYATEGTAAVISALGMPGRAGGEAPGRRPPQRPRRDRRRAGQLRDQHAGGRPQRRCRTASRSAAPPPSAASPASRRSTPRAPRPTRCSPAPRASRSCRSVSTAGRRT